MNKKLQPTLIALSLSVCFGANATVYQIENIDDVFKVNGTIEGSRSGFGVVANSSGQFIGGASGRFAITLTEEEELAITNSRLDVTFAQQQTSATVTTNRVAKIKPSASNFVFDFDQNLLPRFIATVTEIIDEPDTATVESYVFGLSDNNIAVGTTSSAAERIADPDQSEGNTTRDDDFYGYDFAQRGMIIDNGSVQTFAPDFATYGGKSGFTAINDDGTTVTVVGYASVGINPFSQTLIDERCLGTYQDVIPLKVCTGGFSHGNLLNSATSYYLRAFSWQYVNGQLTNQTLLGTLAEPLDDQDTGVYNSIALDINNNGIAVGRSVALRNNNRSDKFDVAVVFKDGEIIDLMDHNNSDWRGSRAVAINDNDLVIGSVTKNFSGFDRNKFFVYDVNSSTEIEFPNDFKGSETDLASNANAINNAGVVVGKIEIESLNSNTVRRTHGFIYDHSAKTFEDINKTLTCSSLGFTTEGDGTTKKFTVELPGGDGITISYETDIVIVDANDIANDGTIMATALVKLPKIKTQWLDEQGEVTSSGAIGATEQVVVVNGEAVFAVDGAGNPVTEQLPRAVILKPTNASACQVAGSQTIEDKFERQGASFGWFMLLLGLVGFGRRKLLK